MNKTVEPTFVIIVQCTENEQPEFHYETEDVALSVLASFQKNGTIQLDDSVTGERRLLSPLSVFVFKEYAKVYGEPDKGYKATKKKQRKKSINIGEPRNMTMEERNRR